MSHKTADLICKQMGYSGNLKWEVQQAEIDNYYGDFEVMVSFECPENAVSLEECLITEEAEGNCRRQYLFIYCQGNYIVSLKIVLLLLK